MAWTQKSFANEKDRPIYVSVEPWPRCFELEPGEELTLMWDADDGEAAEIEHINENEIVVWPTGEIDDIQYLIDGVDAMDRDWSFKHWQPPVLETQSRIAIAGKTVWRWALALLQSGIRRI